MNNKIRLKSNKLVITTVLSGVCLSLFPNIANSATNDIFGLELNYFESAYECGFGEVNVDVKVYKNGQLTATMSKGDSLLLNDIDSLGDLSFEYYSPECPIDVNINQIIGSEDNVPSLAGAYSQTSIQNMVDNLNSYEELYLVELGTDDTSSEVYDLQDVVLAVNHNPNNAPSANDDTAVTTVLASVTIDVLANDTDADGDNKVISQVTPVTDGDNIGTIAIENNQLVYTAGNVPGEYTFNYTVEDESGYSDVGTLIVTVFAFSD